MKLLAHWKTPPEHMKEVLSDFETSYAADGAVPPEGATMLGRWWEIGTGEGFAPFEVEDPAVISGWLMAWSHLVEYRVRAVVDEEDFVPHLPLRVTGARHSEVPGTGAAINALAAPALRRPF